MQKARAVAGLWGWVRGWRRVRRGLGLLWVCWGADLGRAGRSARLADGG
ncbi:hypothetical protein HS961_12495 [Comamonas piscis]|uniref:Uncharacterized protein n=1 Tax=Comamonas piscis TaxID=1562974 RepID=A0A7G5EHV4_9BURK|nr:hypothetical protein [Comamonas piscis]QMV73579.1 hypothetical protein HS961_12495 [Comamonas piscis]WSO32000.1 hypothetical protein VUJ63_12530 [Comamonas piscis]